MEAFSKSGDALHLPSTLFFPRKKVSNFLLRCALQRGGARARAMAMEAPPPQLTVTKVYLTDNPYEKQLDLLRWIRKLLSEVVDSAASHSEDDQHLRQEQEELAAGDACKQDVQEVCILGTPTPEQEGKSTSASTAVKLESTEEVLGESHQDVQTSLAAADVDAAMSSGPVDGSGALRESGPAVVSTGVSASSRKRPRHVMHGQELLGAGSVVECFHPVSHGGAHR